ncbi:hypothetical protein [Staphylococcus marylandisciuri]|uniref:hypothetical protein n=1 Tax=Staphylococcus marylandisciuri TaxID=2981529 RepID=UPI0021CE4236|nr:hypothetical protein [Staphylococcus marylandisciuri]
MSEGLQQRETGKPVSTSTASWGGPHTEKLVHQFLQAQRVGGAPTQRNWYISFYKHSELGRPYKSEAGGWDIM